MCRLRWIAGLVLGTAAVVAGVLLVHMANRSRTSDSVSVVAPTWDPDVEGYEEDFVKSGPGMSFEKQIMPILNRYCVSCHSGDAATGGLKLDVTNEQSGWQRVAEAVTTGRMPPPGKPRPGAVELETLNIGFEQIATTNKPAPSVLRRLNRPEYNNTIRDLVGVTFTPADDFPADDSGDGFDTIGSVLSVSPTLIEKYLIAADAVIERAAAHSDIWNRLRTPPAEDDIPYVLRGTPPQRENAIKGARVAMEERDAARTVEIGRIYSALQAFADRAYRRPIAHSEMIRLMRFVETAINRGEGAETGFKLALKAVLVSPHFLFKVEREPPASEPGTHSQLNDFELATRLSYFLWSSMPDEELFRLAASGKLHDPHVLVAQIRRMLHDAKSRALSENFASQWLQTRALSEVTRDPDRFPGFNAGLVRAMRTETELFFDNIVREDRNIIEFLTGDYTFLNEQLASHYRMAGVRGDRFRRVSLQGTGRTGVVMHASVLTVTSGPTRTSPVKRGKWVLENIIGRSAPSPPPGVDGLKEDQNHKPATIREQFDRHRARADCASCHARLDPLGFGLENFDAIGAWREREGETPIDPSGLLPDGQTFRSPTELVSLLAKNKDDFTRCLARKLLTYGLGRSLEPGDNQSVERIVRHTARNGDRFSSLAIAIARSELFQSR